jgi:C4-type Zn-finger protein
MTCRKCIYNENPLCDLIGCEEKEKNNMKCDVCGTPMRLTGTKNKGQFEGTIQCQNVKCKNFKPQKIKISETAIR